MAFIPPHLAVVEVDSDVSSSSSSSSKSSDSSSGGSRSPRRWNRRVSSSYRDAMVLVTTARVVLKGVMRQKNNTSVSVLTAQEWDVVLSVCVCVAGPFQAASVLLP